MSDLSDVKPYARSVLKLLGYSEHSDPFNQNNIPQNLLDKRFFITQGAAQGVKNNQDNLEMRVPIVIAVHKKAFRNVNAKFDEAMVDAEKIRGAMLAPQTRLTQPNIKNVEFTSVEVLPLSASNEHAMVLNFGFTMLVLVSTRRV